MNKRCRQVAGEIHQQLASLINREIEIPGTLITITQVEITPDLQLARIFLTVLPENKQGTALKILKKSAYHLRGLLKSKIRFYTLPRLEFVLDQGEQKRREISQVLRELND